MSQKKKNILPVKTHTTAGKSCASAIAWCKKYSQLVEKSVAECSSSNPRACQLTAHYANSLKASCESANRLC